MLPPFIIEQIRRREEQERARHQGEQPRLELPLEDRYPARRRPVAEEQTEDDRDRGVLILEL